MPDKKPMIYAHRGASAVCPENTLKAFQRAIDMGADAIELDVHVCADGKLVVIHDENTKRTTGHDALVKDMTWQELQQLDAGTWFSPQFAGERLPSLEDVMALAAQNGTMVNIELKNGIIRYPGLEEKVLALINKMSYSHNVIISSFNHYSLLEIKKMSPKIKTGVLYVAGLVEPWLYAKRLGAEAIHPLFYNIVPEVMMGCISNGIEVNPYVVDEREYIHAVTAGGVSGIITNVPDLALSVIKNM